MAARSQAAEGAQGGETVRVAGIVLKWLRNDKEANYRRAEPMIREAAKNGARIVCTTECFLDGYAIADKTIPIEEYRALGEPIPDGKYCRKLAALAKELNIHLIAGMTEADGDARYNAAVLIGPDGKLVGKYRKQMLDHESVRNTPGEVSTVHKTPFGQVGIMICAADLVLGNQQHVAQQRPLQDRAVAAGHQEQGRVNEDDGELVLLRSRLQERVVVLRPEHAARGADQEAGAVVAELADHLGIAAVGEQDQNKVCYFDLPLVAQPAKER